ncbi:MAG: cysteine--tRNA ligase [Hyphomicrobiales bacterium]|nr:cysteine--tRNA ligase [Hyphomicrobiales bacterium]
MPLKLYNTRTRTKEEFKPIDPANVRMYVCGPTVYDYAHIGNARPVIVFDVLFRLLRHLYGEKHVTYVRNITDVDDKINARALERFPDLPPLEAIRKLTEETTAQFHADVTALGCLPPTHEPRATEYVSKPAAPSDMIRLVERLIERGHAYAAEGHVLFAVATDPNYGKLARRSLDEMQAGARVEVAPYKRDPMDFVLWKPSEPHEPGWDSPWGRGRPGWHLECSAMSAALLGETFDIHGGGIDLVFPHHENEVAQSTCAHGTDVMANVWMHNGFLQVEGQKMSKSLGNFVTINDLFSGWPSGKTWIAPEIKLAMLRSHYRQPIDWTFEGLSEAKSTYQRWSDSLKKADATAVSIKFLQALLDDLNTPAAITILHELYSADDFGSLQACLTLIGVSSGQGRRRMDLRAAEEKLSQLQKKVEREGGYLDRPMAKQKHDLTEEEILASIEESIGQIVNKRAEARARKDWKEADRIRDELAAMGIALKDTKNPETGEIETSWEIAR